MSKADRGVKRAGKALPRKWEPKSKYGPRNSKSRLPGVVINKH
jgi:hypothetical protein